MSAQPVGNGWAWARGLRLAFVLVFVALVGGTVGYMIIEGWGPWDAFYMTVITVATVGYREVHTLSFPGEVFTVVLIFGGVGTDAENVYTVLTARVMRPDLFIIARVESDDAEQKLRRAGADRVISPYRIGAAHMAQTALRPAVVDFVQPATGSGHLDLSMEQSTCVARQASSASRSSMPAFDNGSA